MQDAPGANCGCGDDPTDRDGVCSTCGHAKEWVPHGPSGVVFECPECN